MPYLSKLIKRITLAWSVTALAAMAACTPVDNVTDPDGGEATLVAVLVAPDSADVPLGANYRLVAEARDDRGRSLVGAPVTWSSTDTSIVKVDSTGLVTTVRDGTAEVRASLRGIWGKAKLRVLRAVVSAVTVSPLSQTITRGEAVTLLARVANSSDSVLVGRVVTWSSSAPSVASVDANGRVTALVAGTSTITATSEGRSGSATVSVVEPPPAAPGTVNNLTVDRKSVV